MNSVIKTKIIATLGPSTFEPDKMKKLIEGGVDIFRINFSHGDHKQYKELVKQIRNIKEDMPLMADLKGTEIRTMVKKEDGIDLNEGENIKLVYNKEKVNKNNFSFHYSKVKDISQKGRHIMVDDGKVEFKIEDVKKDHLLLKVITGEKLKDKKSAHFIDTDVPFPLLTRQDREDIEFAIENDFDFIAASMIKSEKEVYAIRGLLTNDIDLVAKIEHSQAFTNIDRIIESSDMILVARGDLGVEMPITKVPIIQKKIVHKCRENGKPVMIATQILDSMMENSRPTRAEVNDIASAIENKVDALMLTGETAAGKYPIESIKILKEVIENTEETINYKSCINEVPVNKGNISESISNAAVEVTYSLPAKAIICFTSSGITAKRVAKFRPNVPVLAFTHDKNVKKRLSVIFGVRAYNIDFYDNLDEMFDMASKFMKKKGYTKPKDRFVITAGVPLGKTGTTNMIKVIETK